MDILCRPFLGLLIGKLIERHFEKLDVEALTGKVELAQEVRDLFSFFERSLACTGKPL